MSGEVFYFEPPCMFEYLRRRSANMLGTERAVDKRKHHLCPKDPLHSHKLADKRLKLTARVVSGSRDGHHTATALRCVC